LLCQTEPAATPLAVMKGVAALPSVGDSTHGAARRDRAVVHPSAADIVFGRAFIAMF